MNPSKIEFEGVCPVCGTKIKWSYLDLATRGGPICPFDGEDFEFNPDQEMP